MRWSCQVGFNFLLADRSRVTTIREWEQAGIRRAGGKAFPRLGDKAYCWCPPEPRVQAS